jgi:hypothetical protein
MASDITVLLLSIPVFVLIKYIESLYLSDIRKSKNLFECIQNDSVQQCIKRYEKARGTISVILFKSFLPVDLIDKYLHSKKLFRLIGIFNILLILLWFYIFYSDSFDVYLQNIVGTLKNLPFVSYLYTMDVNRFETPFYYFYGSIIIEFATITNQLSFIKLKGESKLTSTLKLLP